MEIALHLSFPPFRLDTTGGQFWRDREEIKLRRKTFEVLCFLVNHPGELVTKAILLDAVWGEVVVSDTMPAICVSELRKVLGDDTRAPRFIVTVPRRGYRFIARVTTGAESVAAVKERLLPVTDPLIVGRQQELAQIRRWLMSVIRGTRKVVFVWGEPGIGKTTFVREFLASISGKNATRIAQGQCIEQYGPGEPYLPVIEALTRLCEEPGGADVLAILRQYAPSWLVQMPSMLTEAERERLRDATRDVTQQRMLGEMTAALEALASEMPMVLLLEDLHWSDPSTLELVAAIARRPAAAKLLIVGTYRPAEILAPGHRLRRVKGELDLHHQCNELRLRFLGAADFSKGVSLLVQGRIEEGLARTRRAREFWDRIGYRILFPLELGIESQHCNLDDALGKIARALEETEEHLNFRTTILRFRGALLVRLGADPREVESTYRESIECARDNKWNVLESTTQFARWLNGKGRATEARTLLAEIYGSFTEGFETAALREASVLLNELNARLQPPMDC